MRKLEKEAEKLASLQHPNIIILYGMVKESPVYGLVLEYMHNGSLDEFIDTHREHVTWDVKRKMLKDVITGMSYLHMRQPAIIHRDLKAPNVLIANSLNAKVMSTFLLFYFLSTL